MIAVNKLPTECVDPATGLRLVPLELEQLAHELANCDVCTRDTFGEAWLHERLDGAIRSLPRPLCPDERRRLTDTYRSQLHLLLLSRERAGGRPATTDNDRWVRVVADTCLAHAIAAMQRTLILLGRRR